MNLLSVDIAGVEELTLVLEQDELRLVEPSYVEIEVAEA
jgi:hypothetical protein